MKKLLAIVVLGLLWFIPVSSDNNCVDKNPEIILNLGGTTEPEKIIYATYDSCTKQSDYCGAMGCSLDVFDDKGKYALGYIAKDDWFNNKSQNISLGEFRPGVFGVKELENKAYEIGKLNKLIEERTVEYKNFLGRKY